MWADWLRENIYHISLKTAWPAGVGWDGWVKSQQSRCEALVP